MWYVINCWTGFFYDIAVWVSTYREMMPVSYTRWKEHARGARACSLHYIRADKRLFSRCGQVGLMLLIMVVMYYR
jgi:hypothetical protein